MTRHRIAIFNTGETRRDPRVLRISHLLRDAGHTVRVFEIRADGQSETETTEGLDVTRVAQPMSYSAEAMAEIGRHCPEAGRLTRACDPRVLDREYPRRLTLPHRLPASLRYRWNRWRGLPPPPDAPDPEGQEIARIRFILLTNLAMYHQAAAFRPTLAYCNDLDTLLAGFMLKTNLGVGLTYDAHEIYPEQFATRDRSDIWHRFYTALETALIGHSDARVTVCDSLGAYFARHYDAPGFVTVRNVPSLRHLPPESVLDRRTERPKLLYHGAYFAYRGLDEIIEAAPGIENAEIVFRGFGPHEATLRALSAARGVEDRVTFAEPVGVHDLVPSASACDIGLNPFVDICENTKFALPNKFFEYMMAGLALASSDLVEMRALTRALGVGVLFPDLTPGTIADTVNELLADRAKIDACRAAAYHAARTRFHWEQESQIFLDFFARTFG